MEKNIELKESQKVEFKSNFEKETKVSIESTIKAFLNSYGGTIYIGIGDNSEIIGFDSNKYDDVLVWLADKFKKFNSKINVDLQKFSEKNILLIKVSPVDSENDLVFENDGKIYARVQSSSRKIFGDELLSFCKNRFSNQNENIKKYLEKNFSIENNTIDLIYSKNSINETEYEKFLKFTAALSNFRNEKPKIKSPINDGFYYFNLIKKLTINKFENFEFRFDVLCDFAFDNINQKSNITTNVPNIQFNTLYLVSFIVEVDIFFDIKSIKQMFFDSEYNKYYYETFDKIKDDFGALLTHGIIEDFEKVYNSINKNLIIDQLKSFF